MKGSRVWAPLGIFCIAIALVTLFSSPTSSQGSALASQAKPNPRDEPDTAILRSQLAAALEYQDRLMSTVHWALRITVTVLIAMVAYNWLTTSGPMNATRLP